MIAQYGNITDCGNLGIGTYMMELVELKLFFVFAHGRPSKGQTLLDSAAIGLDSRPMVLPNPGQNP